MHACRSTLEDPTLTTTIAAYGRPRPPGNLNPESFTRVVNGILDGHGVSFPSVVERRVPLSSDNAAALGVGKIERLILEVTFEADPGTVVDILSALENAKEVAAVGRVRIDRTGVRADDDHIVRATISPEAWIASTGTSSGGGG